MKPRLLFILLTILLGATLVHAQATTGVYVTTQDFSSLRAGPGRAFDRLAVVPPEVTLPAVGRTSDTQWIQVEYDGQRGWIASVLLVWSGDVITLPVDGVNPAPYIRRAAALGMTTRDAPIYPHYTLMVPEFRVATIPAGTQIELTGRVGGNGFFRFQARWGDGLYWIGSWDVRIIDGDYTRLLDLTYIFTYGRLTNALASDLGQAVASYRFILDVWQRLERGDQVACVPQIALVERALSDADALREPNFHGVIVPLDAAIASINRAITAFANACADPAFVLTRDYIQTQLAELASANRNLLLVGSLLNPIRSRDPLLDQGG